MAFQSLGAEGALNHTLNLLLINNFMHKFYLIMIKKKREIQERTQVKATYINKKNKKIAIFFFGNKSP